MRRTSWALVWKPPWMGHWSAGWLGLSVDGPGAVARKTSVVCKPRHLLGRASRATHSWRTIRPILDQNISPIYIIFIIGKVHVRAKQNCRSPAKLECRPLLPSKESGVMGWVLISEREVHRLSGVVAKAPARLSPRLACGPSAKADTMPMSAAISEKRRASGATMRQRR